MLTKRGMIVQAWRWCL